MDDDLVYRLRKRAEIRRQIPNRKSVEEGQPDRIADLLDEAADEIEVLRLKFYGNADDGGFDIICDETNNTKEHLDRNELWVEIAVKPRALK
jgi:hypothetical protein